MNFPNFCYFNLTEWIEESNMTEKEENESYKTTGWYLKEIEYKEAFINSYNELSAEERKSQTEQLKALPNFCPKIFLEISWIDIEREKNEKEVEEEMTVEEICKALGKNIKIIK